MTKELTGEVAMIGNGSGIYVGKTDKGFEVAFEYDRELSAMLAQVHGAVFDKTEKSYSVPFSSEQQLTTVIAAMRKEVGLVADDLAAITELATNTALQSQSEAGVEPDVVPQISSFIEPGKVYRGTIVNANTRFVAQETGVGKQDGAAFVQIHRLADLPSAGLFKGDSVAVTYDDKFLGEAKPYVRTKPVDVMMGELEANNGQEVDGVVVTDLGDKIGIGFNFNAAMAARIRRLDGAAFNKDEKVWEVPKEVLPFALYAIEDIRKMAVLDAQDVAELTAVAGAKIDNPKIYQADTRHGANHYGVVVEVGQRFALQSSGRGTFNLHHLSLLDQVPVKGQDVKVEYKDGRGAVLGKQQERGAGVGR